MVDYTNRDLYKPRRYFDPYERCSKDNYFDDFGELSDEEKVSIYLLSVIELCNENPDALFDKLKLV